MTQSPKLTSNTTQPNQIDASQNEEVVSQISTNFLNNEEQVYTSCIEAMENGTCTSGHIDAVILALNNYKPTTPIIHIKNFAEAVAKHPPIGKLILQRIHTGSYNSWDLVVDIMLGIKPDETESQVDFDALGNTYPKDEFRAKYPHHVTQTDYARIKSMTMYLNLTDADILYDLGSGYGRVLTYISINTPTQCKGIEIVPQRVASSQALKERLQLDNLSYTTGSVLDSDFSDGNIFFLYSPFSTETLEAVGEKLQKIAQHKKIKIVTHGGHSANYFHKQTRLKRIMHDGSGGTITFESI